MHFASNESVTSDVAKLIEDSADNKSLVPAGYLPIPRDFDLDVLWKLRDAVVSVVEQTTDQMDDLAESTQQLAAMVSATERSASSTGQQPTMRAMSELDRLVERFNQFELYPTDSLVTDPNALLPTVLGDRSHLALKESVDFGQIFSDKRESRTALAIVQPPVLPTAPRKLIEYLTSLPPSSPLTPWAAAVLERIERLTTESIRGDGANLATLDELERLADDASEYGRSESKPELQNDWLQASTALHRRLLLWRALVARTESNLAPGDFPRYNSTALMHALQQVAALLATDSQRGPAWRDYLLLDRIASASSEGMSDDVEERRNLAQRVLDRMTDPRLSKVHREFIASPPLSTLERELRPWATGQSILSVWSPSSKPSNRASWRGPRPLWAKPMNVCVGRHALSTSS